jgi:hypothetical protein
MSDTKGGFAGDPAEALTVSGTGGCCGNPAHTTLTLPEPASGGTCCGTRAEAAAENSCCGSAAKSTAVAAGQGCCG